MTKKEYLIKLMQAIPVDILPIAPNIMSLLQGDKVWKELIDVLYKMFHEYALTIKDEKNAEKIKKSISFLDKIKSLEEEEHIKNQKDIDELESMLENM